MEEEPSTEEDPQHMGRRIVKEACREQGTEAGLLKGGCEGS